MGGQHSTPDVALPSSPHTAAFDDDLFHERYLLGRLPAEDAEGFEQHYLDCPACLERLETVQTLLDSLRRGAVEDAVGRLRAGVVVSLWRRLQRVPGGAVLLASAAVLCLVAFGGWRLVEQGRQLADLSSRLSILRDSAQHPLQIALAPLRGESPEAASSRRQLSLPEIPQWLSLELDLGLPPGASCDIAYDMEGEILWRRQDLSADGDGRLVLLLLSDQLPAGQGQLVVSRSSSNADGGVVARFPLHVEGAAPSGHP